MKSINSVILEGTVSSETTLKDTVNGSQVCMFMIQANSDNFHVEAWGNLAITCSKHCSKGRGIRLVGRLKNVRWQEVEKTVVIVEHIDFKPKID